MVEAEENDELNLLHPKRLSIHRLLLGHFHWKCLLCSLLIAICAIHVSYCQVHGPKSHSLSHSPGPCSHGYNLIPMALGALLFMIYLSECWHYRSQMCSLPRMGASQVEELSSAMCRAVPVVWWKSVCYHYLRRTRQVARYRNGDVVTRAQVYYERVNSHQSGNVFLYDQCGYRDISKQLARLDKFPMVRLRFSKGFVFACLQAANEFEEQRTRFFSETEMLDDYMEVREGLDLANLPFLERTLVFPDRKMDRSRKFLGWLRRRSSPQANSCQPLDHSVHVPWWLSPWAFWPASLFLLSWPLRMLAECRTGHVHLQVTKLFGTNYLSPSSQNYTGLLTRTSTMDSRELELANRQNYLVVPSYSEAILLDPFQQGTTAQSASLFHQIFSSPRRNCGQPLVSHYAPSVADYGSFGMGKERQKAGRGHSRGLKRRSSIGCFQSADSNELASNEGTQRHLPRPQTLAGQRRLGQPVRSSTISEGIETLLQGEGTGNSMEECSDRMPLLGPNRQVGQGQMAALLPLAMLAEHGEQQPDEPPPPYEMALRFCSPIYQRLRQSAHSISSMFSRSSSRRDLRQTYTMDNSQGPSPSHQGI